MSNIVFILGAGASNPSGCPVMSTFIDTARRLAITQPGSSFYDDYRKVERVQGILQRGFAKSRLDITNLESVFTALEMGEVLGRLGTEQDLCGDDITLSLDAFKRLIAGTIDRTQRYRAYSSETGIFGGQCQGYDQFVGLCTSLLGNKPSHDVGIISFNYDLGLEVAMLTHGHPVDYGFQQLKNDRSTAPSIKLCKLHGSLNWTELNDKIVCIDPVEHLRMQHSTVKSRDAEVMLDSQRALASVNAAAKPLIVPPTESKAQHRRKMVDVWREAQRLLGAAEYIVVVGYSLPSTDRFFRDFFAISMISDTVPRRFHIIDRNSMIKDVYESLLGPAILSRQLLTCSDKGMEHGLNELRDQFGRQDWLL